MDLAETLTGLDNPGVRYFLAMVVGKSTTRASTNILVNADGPVLDLPVVVSAYPNPRVNDPVLCAIQGNRAWVLGCLTTPPLAFQGDSTTPVNPNPTQPTGPLAGELVLYPNDAASFMGGGLWRRDLLYQGRWDYGSDSSVLWVYNGAVHASLAGKKCARIRLYMSRAAGGNYAPVAPNIAVSTAVGMPGTTPGDLAVNTQGPGLSIGQAAWIDLPVGLGQALIDGTWNSIGLMGSGRGQYLVINGPGRDGSSGGLIIDWTT